MKACAFSTIRRNNTIRDTLVGECSDEELQSNTTMYPHELCFLLSYLCGAANGLVRSDLCSHLYQHFASESTSVSRSAMPKHHGLCRVRGQMVEGGEEGGRKEGRKAGRV